MKSITAVILIFIIVGFSASSAQTDQASTDSSTKPSDAPASQSVVPPDSTRPILTHKVDPLYPLEAMRQKLQGRVVIHLVISTAGDVVSAEPVSGNLILTQAAVAAMKQWKFQPYIHHGAPVQIGYKMSYDFAIGDRVSDNPAAEGSTALTSRTADSASAAGLATSGTAQISAGELQKFLLHQVAPVYPDMARQGMIQGTVVLRAIIAKDGSMKGLKVVSGPKELSESALGAVQQWRYKPYTLNGQSVEVESTINVNYKLSH